MLHLWAAPRHGEPRISIAVKPIKSDSPDNTAPSTSDFARDDHAQKNFQPLRVRDKSRPPAGIKVLLALGLTDR
jgi:hypothetical protein